MWIDSHCHLYAPEFDADRAAVVERARAAGVAEIVVPSVDRAGFSAVRALAKGHGTAFALGIHPLFVEAAVDDDLRVLHDALRASAPHDGDRATEATRVDRGEVGEPGLQGQDAVARGRLVAVGEIGLDHFVPGLDAAKQLRFCAAQLRLAREFDLPVILHSRRAVDPLLKQLRLARVRGGIAHAFNGSAQQADAFVALGFKLGFGGALTFERALQIRRLAQTLPADAIVLETDAPDIPPQWLYRTAADRSEGAVARNEPAELPRIAAVLAELRGVSLDALAALTSANVRAALPGLA